MEITKAHTMKFLEIKDESESSTEKLKKQLKKTCESDKKQHAD